MYYITEKNSLSGVYFERKYIFSDNSNITDIIHITAATVNIDDTLYTYLYDSRMTPISPVFNFLNFELQGSSPNNISLATTALKLLYSFLELYNLELQKLTKNDVRSLVSFLEGISMKGTLYTLEFITQRSGSTINSYFAIYRKYISFLGYENSVFLKKGNFKKFIFIPNSEITLNISTYELRKKVYKPEMSTPRYISISNFQSILKVIREEYTTREECIVRLMFECGLRIGEVLGLTNEDILEKDGNTYLHIRNRYSDSHDQLAKTCMNITSVDQYKTKAYNTKDNGYQVVVVNDNLLDKIIDYINEYHLPVNEKFKNNYSKYTIADSVLNNVEDNFYIFINSLGKPLSANLWNKTLRQIFKKAGLDVDKNNRENNLNHRFRHGFAMFMVKYKSIDIYNLKILLRHRSVSSVQHYYRPTDEDIVELKTSFVNSIYDIIPELSI